MQTAGSSQAAVAKPPSGASGTASISAGATGGTSSKASSSAAAELPAREVAATGDKASSGAVSSQGKDGKVGGEGAGAPRPLSFEARASSAEKGAASARESVVAGTDAARKDAVGTTAGTKDGAANGAAGKDAAGTAQAPGAVGTEGQVRGARGVARSRGSATLVTDPPPAVVTATGSQPVRVERSQPVQIERGEPEAARPAAAVTEPLPPNRRGARWPALVIGALVIVGVGYAAIRIGRSRPKPPAVAGLIFDGGVGASTDAGGAHGADAGAAPIDAGAAPIDAGAAPIDAARPPPSAAATAAKEELKRKLDGARQLVERDPQGALDIIDGVLDAQRSARALIARADALHRLKRTDAAASAIGAALSMAPRNAAAWELKGRILWDAGRKEDARPAYIRFLELQSTGATAETVRRRLSGT